LRCAADQGVPPDEIAALQAWLPGGRLNQKRTDALAMLRMMRGELAADPGLKRVSYYFEHTIWWDRVVRFGGLDEVQVKDGAVETLQMGALIDELRLDGRAYGRALSAGDSMCLRRRWRKRPRRGAAAKDCPIRRSLRAGSSKTSSRRMISAV
jgi:hypothetical protein